MRIRATIAILAILYVLSIVGCSDEKQLDSPDKNISLIKNEVLSFDKSLTIGEAFDGYSFFEDKKWKSFETDRKRQVVQFTGSFKNADIMISEGIDSREKFYKELFQTVPRAKDSYETKKELGGLAVLKESKNSIDKLNFVVQFVINRDDSFQIVYICYELLLQSRELCKAALSKKDVLKVLTKIYNNEEIYSFEVVPLLAGRK